MESGAGCATCVAALARTFVTSTGISPLLSVNLSASSLGLPAQVTLLQDMLLGQEYIRAEDPPVR